MAKRGVQVPHPSKLSRPKFWACSCRILRCTTAALLLAVVLFSQTPECYANPASSVRTTVSPQESDAFDDHHKMIQEAFNNSQQSDDDYKRHKDKVETTFDTIALGTWVIIGIVFACMCCLPCVGGGIVYCCIRCRKNNNGNFNNFGSPAPFIPPQNNQGIGYPAQSASSVPSSMTSEPAQTLTSLPATNPAE